jgi:hypothetical protein
MKTCSFLFCLPKEEILAACYHNASFLSYLLLLNYFYFMQLNLSDSRVTFRINLLISDWWKGISMHSEVILANLLFFLKNERVGGLPLVTKRR